MKILSQNLRMGTKIALLSFGLVLLSVLAVTSIIIENTLSHMKNEIGWRALAIARTMAQFEEIQLNVGIQGGEIIIQPICEKIRLATNVEYIVVMDMNKVRYSHPVKERIGKKFAGGDEGPALADNEYISQARGVLGPSVRAFAPVKTDEARKQVGVVVVGILSPTLSEVIHDIGWRLYCSLLVGILIGILGSLLLSRNIKKAMFNLEPEEIARLLEERIAVFQSIREGIVAIDKNNTITIINEEAKRILNIKKSPIGKSIFQIHPESRLPEITTQGIPEYNREITINNTQILASHIPIKVNHQIIGSVAMFKDMTEVKLLAEELTGVKKFVEALRVQNHEHMNKLHTISGLIQLKRYNEAVDYISLISEEHQEITGFLTKNINDYMVAGLLLGKYGRAKELKAKLIIDRSCRLKYLPPHVESSTVAIILGNLLENALEAVLSMPAERKQVSCIVKGNEEQLFISVKDWGPGISPNNLKHIFERGFTTKGPDSRGIGLFLVKQYVDYLKGQVTVSSNSEGTRFDIIIPAQINQIRR